MHFIISILLIVFSGWTLSAHASVLLGLNLIALLLIAPVVIVTMLAGYFLLFNSKNSFLQKENIIFKWFEFNDKNIFGLVALISVPVFLYWSWIAFWLLAVSLLLFCLLRKNVEEALIFNSFVSSFKKFNFIVVVVTTLIVIAIAFVVSRSDLDDSFYVAVAAFASSNPSHIIMSSDPMLGESSFPLIFPSYRFATFELLSGALAYLLSVPAMDVYYVYLLPVWVIAAVAANFLLTNEIIPKHWLLAGIVALVFTLLLGEMHRSPANFSFVRIFQGKAVFLVVIVPTVFYLTAKFFSERGTKADLFLLACCQIVSVGLTNFGMLMGPLAGFGAIISNIPLVLKGDLKKLYYAFSILFIPLPYLINVALESKGSSIMNIETETAANVWTSVFGTHQQYLVGILILAGPVLAKDVITKWQLAVPPLLLFLVYLNPWLSVFISKYVTTPPVYWRVVWSFPVLIFTAISFCMIALRLFERRVFNFASSLLAIVVLVLTIYSLPFNTLRIENIGLIEGFANWKVSGTHLVVAQKAVKFVGDTDRLLAPDEIAGVISRFEYHPKLVSTRGLYLDLMKPLIGEVEYTPRRILYNFVTGKLDEKKDQVSVALRTLDVSVIVLNANFENEDTVVFLRSQGYLKQVQINGYSIWVK